MRTKIKVIMFLMAVFAIKANSQITINSITVTNATSCSVCNGRAIANVSGGFMPYTYYWSNLGHSNQSASDTELCPGTYYLAVQDAHGDTALYDSNNVFTIGPAPVVDTLSTTNATCSNNNGTATANVSGGSAPYTYTWMPGGQTTSSITGLSAGTYTCIVTDAGGCNDTSICTIAAGGLYLTLSETDALCNGGNTGSATVTNVSGGVAPYTYLWTPGGQTTSTATGLSAGSYYVNVTDANGCSGNDSIIVGEPYPLTFDTLSFVTGASCTGNNGTAYLGIYGGTYPYTYSWTPSGETTAEATGLSAGTYTVTITDANGCSVTNSAVVPASGPIDSIVTGNDSCYGESNGFASVASVSGGIAPYTYSWAPGGSTNSTITGLSAGNYTVTVTDSTGCSGTTLVTIYQPAQIVIYDTITAADSGCNGTAWVTASGGTAPYTYNWYPSVNSHTDTSGYYDYADSLCSGSYLLCVTDANGCSTCDSIHVGGHALGVGNIKENTGGIKLYPDPVSDQLNLATDGLQSGVYSVYVYDMLGRQVMQNDNITIYQGETIQVNVSHLPTGKYMLRLGSATCNKIAPFIVTH